MTSSSLQTALIDAVKADDAAAVRACIDRGADTGIKDERDSTPLHVAAVYDCLDAVRALLADPAQLDEVNKFGKTPLDLAYGNDNTRIAAYMTRWLDRHMRESAFEEEKDRMTTKTRTLRRRARSLPKLGKR